MKANVLKATDLMVGDWVMLQGKPYMIDMLNGYQESSMGVEPIPLTPEILEKNGFESMRVSWGTYELVGVNKRVEMHNDNDWVLGTENTWCAHIKTANEEYMIAHCELTYVHELQHILRLCKIDKEIVV
jgi:hypothetical protein